MPVTGVRGRSRLVTGALLFGALVAASSASASEAAHSPAVEVLSRAVVENVKQGARGSVANRPDVPPGAVACIDAMAPSLILDAMSTRLEGRFSPDERAELDRVLAGPFGTYLEAMGAQDTLGEPPTPTPDQAKAMAAFDATPLSARLWDAVVPQPPPHADGSVEAILLAEMERCAQVE